MSQHELSGQERATAPAGAGFQFILRYLDLGAILSIMLFVVLMGGWQLAVKSGLVPAFVLPAPSDVAARFLADIFDKAVLFDCGYTLVEILSGFLIAAIAGVALGAVIALVPLVDRVLSPYIVALQTIPKVAIAPVLIVWFGFGIESKIVIVALIAFFPILVNVVLGFRGIDPRQIVLMKVLDASTWQVFRKVRIPNALPSIMAGMYIAMVFSVIGAVVGEFLGSAHGLGAQIMQRQAAMDVVGVYSVLVLLTGMGILLNTVLKAISRRLVFWGNAEEPSGL
ncbi:MAG: ABC transporter permease [Bradyrhizobium sp.]|nr:ABC transporter permease [Bradyrhizobium sp.]